MNAREMHYDYKQKLNKVDSQKWRNLIVPEIDWKLNEAQEIFIKLIAEPRLRSELGFEVNQRTIDDIKTVVIDQNMKDGTCIVPTIYDESSFIAVLPDDYWFHVKSKGYGSKNGCLKIPLKTTIIRHDDEHELSPFDRSNFEWRKINLSFNRQGLRIFTDGTFQVNWICIDYIKKLRRIHNAQDFIGGTYNTLDGTALTGTQACELPNEVHREIVDLAVLITAMDLSLPDIALKESKLNLTK